MQIYRSGKRGIYWVRFQHEGIDYRQSLRTSEAKVARHKAAEIHRRVLAGERASDEPTQPELTCLDLLAEYRDHLLRRGRTKRHVTETCATIARIIADSGAVAMKEFDTPSIERSLGYLADRSARTQNMAIGAVRAWCRWLARTGRWTKDPAQAIDKARSQPARLPRRALTPEELDVLTSIPTINPSRRLLYGVAAASGLRRSELAALQVSDVEFSGSTIVHRSHSKRMRAGSTFTRCGSHSAHTWQRLASPYP